MFSPADQQTILGHIATVDGVVAAGPSAFDDDAMTAMLLAASGVVNLLDDGVCDGYLLPSDS